MKKLLSFLFMVMVSIGTMFAYDLYVNGIYYNIVNGEAEVTYKTNWYTQTYYQKNVNIPEIVNGYTVTKIGEYAFSDSNVEYLTLPNTIREIGKSAFSNCILQQKTFHFPDSLEEIADNGFSTPAGPYVDTIYLNAKLRKIGEFAFSGWSATVVYYTGTIEDWLTIKHTGKYRSVPWNDDTYIYSKGYELFINGYPLTNLVIPSGMEDGLRDMFLGCSSIESVEIPEGYTTLDNTFYHCINLESVSLPQSITTLKHTFSYCQNLTQITLPDSLKKIGQSAFCNTGLTEFCCTHIDTIDESAFSECPNLISVDLVGDLKRIGAYAFEKCNALRHVHIGKNVNSMSSSFYKCDSIEYVVIDAETPPAVSSWKSKERIFPTNTIIYVPFESLPTYASRTTTWAQYFDLRGHKEHYLMNITHTPTTLEVEFESDNKNYRIISSSVDSVEFFSGNVVRYDGLDVMSRIPDMTLYILSNHNEYFELNFPSYYSSPNLIFNTYAPEIVSSDFAVLFASTNAAEYETHCGFEIGLASTEVGLRTVGCTRDSCYMRSRVYGLLSATDYKYRPIYTSKTNNITYGEWHHFRTANTPVHVDATLRTDSVINITETSATLRGYILAGSEEITEQGFEYWAYKRANDTSSSDSMPAIIGQRYRIPVSGTKIQYQLENLDEGTVYYFRTYADLDDITAYGQERMFTTLGEYVSKKYIITFLDWDGTQLQQSYVEELSLPVYEGHIPLREDDEQYIYEFIGWTPDIVVAVADAVYTATYRVQPKTEDIYNTNDKSIPTKLIREGQLLIFKNGKTYTLQGQEKK